MGKVKPRLTVVKHPMVSEQLTLARDRSSNQVVFRKAIFRLGRLMAYEFLRSLETTSFPIETPLGRTTGHRVKGKDKIVIIMVLRASIPFVEGMYKMLPLARTGVISAWRGKGPRFAVEVNYAKVPKIHPDDVVIIADPMLATGHTLVEVAKRVIEKGKPKRLAFFSVISTAEGVQAVAEKYPEAEFYTCAVDPLLDEHAYIVPGLGDAGDRSFGSPT
jgi:uracil phosphoribosyltransferase